MATSQVRKMNKATGKQIVVVDRRNRPRWSEAFENNPRISPDHGSHTVTLLNAGGSRPYIQSKTNTKWTWKTWDISAGEVFLSEAEREFAKPFAGRILVEPNCKEPNGNKAWPFHCWQELVNSMGPGGFIQVGSPGSRQLNGVDFLPTTFRQAMAVQDVSAGFVGCEGALHHSAAAQGVPSVVLWSHFIDPRFTGYGNQTNIRHAVGWCGNRVFCQGCKDSMNAITVDEVRTKLTEVLQWFQETNLLAC